MNISVSFSGGVTHTQEVSEELQQAHANRIAAALQSVLEKHHAGGSGTVVVGTRTASISATPTTSLDDEIPI